MTTATSTTLKTAGMNILAYLAAYLLQKAADKNTGFTDTRTAITNEALTAASTIIAAKLTAVSTTTAAPETPAVTIAQ